MTSAMIKVCLPTTKAFVEIQRIFRFPEAMASTSTMCRGGTKTVGVDKEYNAFVKSPQGCIELLFGHGKFRLDVSAPVDSGSSWELAVLVAHAAEARNRLSQSLRPDTPEPDVLVCATGSVLPINLAVGEVAEIPRKLELAQPTLLAARGCGLRVVLAVPAGNLADIPSPIAQALGQAGVEILAIDNARKLTEALALELPASQAATVSFEPGTNPYPGLRAFGQGDQALYFGRRRARDEVMRRLRGSAANGIAFVLVHGRSGIGKSSLLRAGLAADVRRHCLPGRRWRVVEVTCAPSAMAGPPADDLLRRIAPHSASVEGALASLPDQEMVLVLLDQLEQALIDLPPAQGQAFGDTVRALALSQRVWIAASIRTDQLDALDLVPELARLAQADRTWRLEPPSLFELSEMILKPAAAAGLRFEPGPNGAYLPDMLAQIALGSPGSVPLLQVVLERLARMAGPDGAIAHEAYDELGGFENAVKRLAEDALDRLPAELSDPRLVDRTLAGLIRFEPETGRPLARPATRPPADDPAARILQHLVEGRILIEDDGAAGNPGLRVAHEILIDAWPRLHDLAQGLRDDLQLRDRIETSAADWQAVGRDDGLLINSETRVADAESLIAAGRVALSPDAEALVAASRKQIDRRATTRRRLALAIWTGTAAMLVLAVVAIGFSLRAQQAEERTQQAEARNEALGRTAALTESRALALLAQTLVGTDPVAALRLALAAWPERPADHGRDLDLFLAPLAAAMDRPRPMVDFRADDMGTPVSADISADGRHVLVRYLNQPFAHLWDARTGDVIRRLGDTPHGSLAFAGFSADGTQAVIVQGDEASLWNVETGENVRQINMGPDRFGGRVALSSDGTRLAVVRLNGTPEVLSVAENEVEVVLGGRDWEQVTSLAFSPTPAQLLVTGSREGVARLWDLSEQIELHAFPGHGTIERATFSSDGKQIAVVSDDGAAVIWDVETGAEILRLDDPGEAVTSLDLSTDGRYLVTGAIDGAVTIREVDTGMAIRQIDLPGQRMAAVAFVPDSRAVLTAAHDSMAVTRAFIGGGTVQIWDPALAMETTWLRGHRGWVSEIAVSPDGRLVATSTQDGTVRLWNSTSGESLQKFILSDPDTFIVALAFPFGDDRVLAVGRDGTRWYLDPADPSPPRSEEPDLAEAFLVTLSDDGRFLYTGGRHGEAMVRRLAQPGPTLPLPGFGHSATGAVFSADGRYLAVGALLQPPEIWDLTTGTRLSQFGDAARLSHRAVFSPDGQMLADAGTAGATTATLVLRDVATGAIRHSLSGHFGAITGIVFMPDGRQVITTSDDRSVIVWDVETGVARHRLTDQRSGHRGAIAHASQLQDGRFLITVDESGLAVVWDTLTFTPLRRVALDSQLFAPRGMSFIVPSANGRFHVIGVGNSAVILHWGLATLKGENLVQWACNALDAMQGADTAEGDLGLAAIGSTDVAQPRDCTDYLIDTEPVDP